MKILVPLLFLFFFCTGTLCAAEQAKILIDRQEMAQVVDDYLAEQSRQLPNVELKLVKATFPDPYEVPQGRIEHQVLPAKPDVIGSRRLTLITRVDGRTVSNRSIRVDLEAFAEVAVATESLRRGEILDSSQVELVYQDISRIKDPVFNIEDISGKRLKRSLRNGEPLQRQQIEVPPVIHRGERVVIEAHGPGLVLSAVGEAKQDGHIGESIRVINSGSRKEVLCLVVASGLVRVRF
jgi:flagella basal body P-ring formation protein FlgA